MNAREPYVLATAAYNEGKYIEATILAIISQDVRPVRWVIVSDGSTDDTDAIVSRYAATNDFIRLHRLVGDHPRNFEAQAHAINAGFALLRDEAYSFIGNLDADITFEPSYFRLLLDKFRRNALLGLAGGTIWDKCKEGAFRNRKSNNGSSVAHAVQLFRRECFQAIGNRYPSLPYGGPDTYAETMARMKGWQVASFPDLHALHHRPTGLAGGMLRSDFRRGMMDHSLRVLPLFEVAKLVKRFGSQPWKAGQLVRLTGYIFSCISGREKAVPDRFMEYLRQEQRRRLEEIFQPKRIIKLVISVGFLAGDCLRRAILGLLGRKPGPVCVTLYYHSVPDKLRLTFARQMDIVLALTEPVSISQIPQLPPGRRYCAVTFDDGFENIIRNAVPELLTRSIPATAFLTTTCLGKYARWWPERSPEHHEALATIEMWRQLPANLITIGSHTLTHPHLPCLIEAEARRELYDSRLALAHLLSRDITSFSFPYGDFNADLVRWCRDAGYELAFTSLSGNFFRGFDSFVFGRVSAEPMDWELEFRLKLLGAYRWLPFAILAKRKMGSIFKALANGRQKPTMGK